MAIHDNVTTVIIPVRPQSLLPFEGKSTRACECNEGAGGVLRVPLLCIVLNQR